MATTQTAIPLSHFHPQIEGSEHLSQNLASNEIFTPLQQGRITVSPSRFEQYRSTLVKQPRLPWGRSRDYGGLQKVQLPSEFIKLKGYPPDVVQKGHRHYGSGSSDPRDLAVQQYYDITNLHRSDVRSNDQLLPSCPSKDMNETQVDLPFPAEHPYYSHTSRLSVFPKFNSPDDPKIGDPSRSQIPLHHSTPANPYRVVVVSKTKGAPYRREIQEYPFESEKYPLTWGGEEDYYNLNKSAIGGRQQYYPTPHKIVHPNLRLREENQRLELRSANTLRNIERDQWKTVYQYNFTGNGPSNAMHLDDYHQKSVAEMTEERDTRDDELLPKSAPVLCSPRPQEGRFARLYQGRRHISAPIRYRDKYAPHDPPDVVDQQGYLSLPASYPVSRMRDEWYKTNGPNSADDRQIVNIDSNPKAREDNNDLARYYGEDQEKENADDIMDEHGNARDWKIVELSSHPDHGLGLVRSRFSSSLSHSTPDISATKWDIDQKYLKDYQAERDEKFRSLSHFHEQQKLELQYLSEHDLHALRNKTDQMGNRLEPKALDQHGLQVSADEARLRELRQRVRGNKERFQTGLKYSTEKITDNGVTTDIHDRQLEGYKTTPKDWYRDIPQVESPRQNHGGEITTYVNKSNPFSLSMDADKANSGSRIGQNALKRSSSTGSILKTPGSPPRTGASKSISFNEVVRVATTEYGQRYRFSTSPLTNSNEIGTRGHHSRPSTPVPMPVRSRREPSIHANISPRGPSLRPTSSFPLYNSTPTPQHHWAWNYDHRMASKFEPNAWSPRPYTTMPQTSLLEMQDNESKSDAHRRFRDDFPETAPDYRDNTRLYELADKSADLRFKRAAQHREKRHQFYGINSYYFYNGSPVV